ncbi:ABC-2 type transport system permease protein [Thalassobacillus cyri]|uniref:ABC-2 type transport system permease protein n=1 Tax=Thalassobacillus cyri TaxID=571932 RepID=A0A1H3YV24_9BACI|nr:ABC transporter permease [Thalassobacillus cyri]SEA15336.1 ABC-2 type transport system permease protein [Thalassobacillus cyri]
MMQFMTVFKREMLEAGRNFKWIWVPLVFILLGITDPISTYYMPQIIESVGGLPEGATFEIPTPPPHDVLMMSLAQYSQLGVLVVALMSMGLISGERKSGVAELVLVKPVKYSTYVTAKWGAVNVLVLVSFFAGMLASWYYVNLLFGDVSFIHLLWTWFFYGLWLLFVISISVFMNTLFKVPGLVGFLTILFVIITSIITNIFSHVLDWSPAKLSGYIRTMLSEGSIPADLWGTALVTIGISTALLIAAIYTFRTKEMA